MNSIAKHKRQAKIAEKTTGMTFMRFLLALQEIETGGEPHGGVGAIGDNGQALGPLQIHRGCHKDAMEHLGIKMPYKHVATWEGSVVVALGYFLRWAPLELIRLSQLDMEKMARIWNGGPQGYRKKQTLPYLEKFRKVAQ